MFAFTTDARPSLVAVQNDAFRRRLGPVLVGSDLVNGQTVVTPGIAALRSDEMALVLRAVQRADDFTPDNDPDGQHDYGVVEIQVPGREPVKAFWKIDLYDPAYEDGPDDAADVRNVRRVLTMMLPSEY